MRRTAVDRQYPDRIQNRCAGAGDTRKARYKGRKGIHPGLRYPRRSRRPCIQRFLYRRRRGRDHRGGLRRAQRRGCRGAAQRDPPLLYQKGRACAVSGKACRDRLRARGEAHRPGDRCASGRGGEPGDGHGAARRGGFHPAQDLGGAGRPCEAAGARADHDRRQRGGPHRF